MPTFATRELQRSLRRFITFDQVTCLAAVAVILGVYGGLHASGYLLLLAGVVTLTALTMGLGRRPLAAGDLDRAVLWVAVANWGVSLSATAVAPFCLPITVVAAMLPSVLAVPYVGPRSLWRISRISMCVSTLAVVAGTTQDFSGLTDGLHRWIPPTVLLVFVPFISGLVVMVSAHNSARLKRALSETLEVNSRLRATERALTESRTRLVAVADEERRRIARDIHDGAQQRLLALALRVQRARAGPEHGRAALDGFLERLSGELKESMAELRNLAQGVYPAVLTDRGLREALVEMAARAPCHCEVTIGSLPRCAPEVEASVYWCCVEALQNVAKHARGARARLRVSPGADGAVTFAIEDDGPGFDRRRAGRGHGLTNMADRIGAVGGQLMIWSVLGAGVRVHGMVPAAGEANSASTEDVSEEGVAMSGGARARVGTSGVGRGADRWADQACS